MEEAETRAGCVIFLREHVAEDSRMPGGLAAFRKLVMVKERQQR